MDLADLSIPSEGLHDPRQVAAELARMERAFGESSELARLAMQAGRMFAFEWNPITDEVLRSHDCADIVGINEGATRDLGQHSVRRVHPEDRERLVRTVRILTPANATYETEYRVIQPGGKIATFRQNARGYFDGEGRLVRLIGMTADITERKQAEAALLESELRYKEVFDNFSECIFVLDVTSDCRFKFVGLNPAEEKALGLSSFEVAGKFIEEVFSEDVAQPLIEHYRHCLEVGTVINYDDELKLPNGPRFFHTNLIPVRNGEGRIHRIVGCCMDFTDLKRAQEEAAARQKLETVGTLAGGIAHDFNNLLGGILASTELILAERPDDAVLRETLLNIRTVTIRGAEIVRQLMIYGGKDSPAFEPVDVSRLVEEMVRLLVVSISKHSILKTDLGKDLPAVHANPGQMRQVVMNLISNASDAMGERDGVILVSTRKVRIGRDTSFTDRSNPPEGDYLKLEVSDAGCGMTPEVQSRIFDPFFTTKFPGRGLGLAVTRGIVQNHGGSIHVVSAPGKGTVFQIFLPLSGERARESDYEINQVVAEQSPPSKQTILVVEDEAMLRLAFSKALRKQGYSVIEADNGSTAIATIGKYKESLDAILLDVTLPGASSREVLENALLLHPEARVILTSAYGKETVDTAFAGLRVEHFLRKPFPLSDLFRLLRHVLSA